MQKTIKLFILALFGSSVFTINESFVNANTPTHYIVTGGCCVLIILVIVQNYKQQTHSLSITEALSSGFLLYAIVYGSINGSLNPEWITTGLSLVLFYSVVIRINISAEWLYVGLVVTGIAQALYGFGQYMHRFSNIAAPNFRMSGSFDNPAGFAVSLSVCFPFALFLLHKSEIYWKILGGLSAVLFIVAVGLSQSRAGVVSVIVMSGVWAVKALNLKWLNSWSRRTKIGESALLIIILLVGLYFLKKDSANGRILIWQCSVHMIADKPLFGHGMDGFQREYMLYQAEYFRNHPNSSFAMLADIVKHPFNEYLLFLVEYGLVGGLLMVFFVFYLIREYCKNTNL